MTPEDQNRLQIIHNNASGLGSCVSASDRGFEDWAIENGPKFRAAINGAIEGLSAPLREAPEFVRWQSGYGDWVSLQQAVTRMTLPEGDEDRLRTIRRALMALGEQVTEAEHRAAAERLLPLYEALTPETQSRVKGVKWWLEEKRERGPHAATDAIWSLGVT